MKKFVSVMLVCMLALTVFAACAPSTQSPSPSASVGASAGASADVPTPSVAPSTEASTQPSSEATATAPVASTAPSGTTEGYEIALVTDVGTIDDESFNQGSWEGVVAYATANNKTHKYYQPVEQSTDSYLSTIDLAVKGGAKIIVCPGYLFEPPIYVAQDKYPDVKFILIDGRPNDGKEEKPTYKTGANTYSILYAEEQAGFLAGYAAVKDGYKKLGFMGGIAVPAVIRYGHGFVAGADYAAKEMGIAKDEISIEYMYVGSFVPSPDIQSRAASWYQAGTEVIFSCGGGIYSSIVSAAESAGAKVIGVDVDQSSKSETIITSAIKGLSNSVEEALELYYADKFPGGVDATLTATEDCVGLPQNWDRMKSFKQEDYDKIYAALKSGEIAIPKDDVASPAEIGELVKVNAIE